MADFIELQTAVAKQLQNIGHPDIVSVSKEIALYLQQQKVDTKGKLNEIVSRLNNGEPWEYIRGSAIFCGNNFFVNEDALIPRIETEELVMLAYDGILAYLMKNTDAKINVVDIGTGSGAIIISLYKMLEKHADMVTFYGIDISSEALDIAKKNARFNKAKIIFIHADILPAKSNDEVFGRKTFIIANLPYIPHKVYLSLDKSVKNYEPQLALDAGDDGCMYYRELQKRIVDFIIPPTLYLEIDPTIMKTMKALFPMATFSEDQFKRIRFVELKDIMT